MPEALDGMKDQVVVLDLVSQYVIIGTLEDCDEHRLTLADANVHDLRASGSTREFYVFQAKETGLKVNRRRVVVRLEQVVSVSALNDVTV